MDLWGERQSVSGKILTLATVWLQPVWRYMDLTSLVHVWSFRVLHFKEVDA